MLAKCMFFTNTQPLKPDDIDKSYFESKSYAFKDQTTAQDAFNGSMKLDVEFSHFDVTYKAI